MELTEEFSEIDNLDSMLATGCEQSLAYAFERKLLDGLAIGIVKDDRAYVRTLGERIMPYTCFEIGSVTKLYTAQALNAMVDRSLLAWNDTVADHIRDNFPGILRAKEALGDITILDLAVHRSGLPLLPPNIKYIDKSNPYGHYAVSDLEAYIESTFLKLASSNRYSYSNLGFAVLGYLLEQVTATPFSRLIQDEVLHPLGLDDTSFALTSHELPPICQGHSEAGREVPRWSQLALAPAGGLCSTVVDQIKLIKFLLQSSSASPIFKLYQSSNKDNLGIVWELDAQTGFYKRDGMTDGFSSYLSVNMTYGYGLVLLSNRNAQKILNAIARNCELALLGMPIPALSGDYGRARALFVEKVKNNRVLATAYRKMRNRIQ